MENESTRKRRALECLLTDIERTHFMYLWCVKRLCIDYYLADEERRSAFFIFNTYKCKEWLVHIPRDHYHVYQYKCCIYRKYFSSLADRTISRRKIEFQKPISLKDHVVTFHCNFGSRWFGKQVMIKLPHENFKSKSFSYCDITTLCKCCWDSFICEFQPLILFNCSSTGCTWAKSFFNVLLSLA